MTTGQALLDQLKIDTAKLAMHLSNASWQYQQFKEVKNNLPADCLLMVMDFAENFRTKYRAEIQSARWAYKNVTIHPFVCYYSCPHPDCCQLVTEYDVMISDDLKHDSAAVKKFTTIVTDDHIQRRTTTLRSIYQYSDGCAAQYKCHSAFLDVSRGINGIPVTRNFFGSGHGKGPADGTAAVMKQAIKSGTVKTYLVIC